MIGGTHTMLILSVHMYNKIELDFQVSLFFQSTLINKLFFYLVNWMNYCNYKFNQKQFSNKFKKKLKCLCYVFFFLLISKMLSYEKLYFQLETQSGRGRGWGHRYLLLLFCYYQITKISILNIILKIR